jgi:predicted GNAT family acetyltransferase
LADVTDHPAKRGGITPPALLNASHDLIRFDCGNDALNDWLKVRAIASEGRTARTYVVCEGKTVVGYYCLASGGIQRGELPKALRKHGLPNAVPVVIIGRLARDLSYKGSGLGLDLLQHALSRIVHASETIGIRCVLAHAIDEKAAKFWKENEFIESPIGSRTFFLPVETIIDGLND